MSLAKVPGTGDGISGMGVRGVLRRAALNAMAIRAGGGDPTPSGPFVFQSKPVPGFARLRARAPGWVSIVKHRGPEGSKGPHTAQIRIGFNIGRGSTRDPGIPGVWKLICLDRKPDGELFG